MKFPAPKKNDLWRLMKWSVQCVCVCLRVICFSSRRSVRNQSTNYTQFTKLIICIALNKCKWGWYIHFNANSKTRWKKKWKRERKRRTCEFKFFTTFFRCSVSWTKNWNEDIIIIHQNVWNFSLFFFFSPTPQCTWYRFQWIEKAENRIILLTRR